MTTEAKSEKQNKNETHDNSEASKQKELDAVAIKTVFGSSKAGSKYGLWFVEFADKIKDGGGSIGKTNAEILKDNIKQLDKNMKATLGEEKYKQYKEDKKAYFESITSGFELERKSKTDDIFAKIQIGISMLSIYKMNKNYSIDLFEELGDHLAKKDLIKKLSPSTQQRYFKLILTPDSENKFSGLNGQNNDQIELNLYERFETITPEELEKLKNPSMTKLQFMKKHLNKDELEEVLGGTDQPYIDKKASIDEETATQRDEDFDKELKTINEKLIEKFDDYGYGDAVKYTLTESGLRKYRKKPKDKLIRNYIIAQETGKHERKQLKRSNIQLQKEIEKLQIEIDAYKEEISEQNKAA